MFAISHWQILALAAVAFAAGTVDAIAGGGGLLTVPALLAMGLPPHAALATNKGQSVFGALAALVRFAWARSIDWRRAWTTFPAGLVGSLAGAGVVLTVSAQRLRLVVVAMLLVSGTLVGLRRPKAETPTLVMPNARRRPTRALASAVALVMGVYDGFFGPGTGTFLIVAFAVLLGDRLSRATADAKVVNFASNLAAFSLFAARGTVVWRIALPMAAAQLAGGWLGAHLAVRRGDVLVQRAVVLVAIAVAGKLLADMW